MHKKIVWYVQPYAGGPGVGRYYRAFYLAKEWKKHSIETHIFCAANHHLLFKNRIANSTENIDGVHYHFLEVPNYEGNGIRRLLNMFMFGRSLEKLTSDAKFETPDAIIYSSPHLLGAPRILKIAKRMNANFLFEVRDLWPMTLLELSNITRFNPLYVYMKYVERLCYKKSDKVVSLLPKSLEYMKSQGANSSTWSYIPNGVDPTQFEKRQINHSIIDSELVNSIIKSAKEGRKTLVYAGALGVPNNVVSLVDTIASLSDSDKNRISVYIIGRGTEFQKLKVMSKGLPIHIHHQIPKSELLEVLNIVDGGFISLAPSNIFRYGISPNKIFDYMQAELPIISTIKAGNNPVQDANCGFYLDPNSSNEPHDLVRNWLNTSKKELQILGRNGKTWVKKNHDYKMLANKYVTLM